VTTAMALLEFEQPRIWSSSGGRWLLLTTNWTSVGRGKGKHLTGETGSD